SPRRSHCSRRSPRSRPTASSQTCRCLASPVTSRKGSSPSWIGRTRSSSTPRTGIAARPCLPCVRVPWICKRSRSSRQSCPTKSAGRSRAARVRGYNPSASRRSARDWGRSPVGRSRCTGRSLRAFSTSRLQRTSESRRRPSRFIARESCARWACDRSLSLLGQRSSSGEMPGNNQAWAVLSSDLDAACWGGRHGAGGGPGAHGRAAYRRWCAGPILAMQHRVRRFNSKSGAHASTSAPRPGTRRGSSASGRTRTSLRESEELHRATLANISDTVLLTDDAGRFTYVCPNVDVIFGCTPDEVHALGSIDALFGAKLFEPGELALRGEIRNIECEVAIGSGLRRTVLVHVKSVSIKGGTRLYCCRDVTELRQAEEEARAARADLAHASRLMMAGALTASIAHEITQPLTAIVGDAGVALEVFQRRGVSSNAAELREILTDIIEEGRQAADIVQRIRALARKRPLSLQALDVNEVAKDALHFLSGDALRRQ